MALEGKLTGKCPQPEDLKIKIEKLLYEVNKPSQYIGLEAGAFIKNWDTAKVKTCIAFPDMYEIGVSNLGHRILYSLINSYDKDDFLADRAYAPANDFKEVLKNNNLPLFAVESYRALSEFDVIAFSLQYELSYPTILAMLEMGGIKYKSSERGENAPLIIAGGPGSYNPEPLNEFIDAFIIGDGEEVLIEVLEEVNKAKSDKLFKDKLLENLTKIEGIYVPKFYKPLADFGRPYPIEKNVPEKVCKRISDMDVSNVPVQFPVPYLSTVHDRAVIEIRRGCSRMCRFCQSCFVNLPVRDRKEEDIITVLERTLKNTGYDEYSLLSLSSSDYKNIESLVSVLNSSFEPEKISLSLPSQRADAFSLKLAQLVQSVRKSTLTFAPEAGSQRLRDVINKNLNEDQIFNAVLTSYQAGWNKIKLYFMIGLPNETFEDLDEIINLLKKIKDKTKEIAGRNGFNTKPLDLTCTVSTFVPKSFTPFQWYGQNPVELIEEKISYLKEKAQILKGVKLNFNDSFLCRIEAVFARGDRRLNSLIENVYRKGSYLDAWEESFNKHLWEEAAIDVGIDLEFYASREINPQKELPWDFIDTGLDKNWLIDEYKKSLEAVAGIPCDEKCSNCGVCSTFNKKPLTVVQSPVISKSSASAIKIQEEERYRYRLKLQKIGFLKYISHLDWLRMIYRAMRKAGIKLCFTQGFNPSPKIAIGNALPLFTESICEYADIEILSPLEEELLKAKINEFLPEESKILKIVKIPKEEKALDRQVSWAKYVCEPLDLHVLEAINLNYAINDFLSKDKVFFQKEKHKALKHKSKIRVIDIKPCVQSVLLEDEDLGILKLILSAGQGHVEKESIGKNEPYMNKITTSLRADKFLEFLYPSVKWKIKRISLLDGNLRELI